MHAAVAVAMSVRVVIIGLRLLGMFGRRVVRDLACMALFGVSGVEARLAPERQRCQPGHIKRGHHSGCSAQEPKADIAMRRTKRLPKDLVLGEESRKRHD